MVIKLSDGNEYRTEERIALNGQRVVESIGKESSSYKYDCVSFLYNEESKLRFILTHLPPKVNPRANQ
jgi:hypothetical protein